MITRLLHRLRTQPWRREAILLPTLLALTVALQWLGGAFDNEFGGHPDEAAHYVTGLMLRDYLASGFHSAPMAYAKDYYNHYPKVALGNWPPVFYLMQSAWTLPFGVSRASIILFMAVLTVLVARILFAVLEPEAGVPGAWSGALAFLLLPLVREHAGMVMTEIPVTLFTFLATIFFGRFVDGGKAADSLLFGLFAGVAIMTKGSGLALALVPPLVIVITRRFDLLTRPALWISAAIVAVIAGPWTLKFRETAKAGWLEDHPSWHFTREAIQYYPLKLWLAAGAGLFVLAMVGATVKLGIKPRENGSAGRWAAFSASVIGVVIFQSVVPAGLEPRHLLPALPPLLCLGAAGLVALPGRFASGPPRAKMAFAGSLVFTLLALVPYLGHAPAKSCAGFAPLAEKILREDTRGSAVLFVSSDARGEGQFISEVAMREPRPGHVIQRASKVLASSTWGGEKYQPKAGDEAGVIKLLQENKIDFVVIDEAIPSDRRRPHHDLLKQTITGNPRQFQLLAQGPSLRFGAVLPDAIRVYRLTP